MHDTKPAKITSPIVSLSDDYVRTIPVALIVGIIGLVVAFFLGGGDFKQFSYNYLTSFCFLLTICLGCLFFVIIMHLTRAGWSVTVRRIAELLAICVVPLFLLFLPILIPVLLGWDTVYSWNALGWAEPTAAAAASVKDLSDASPLEQMKALFLNPIFFGIRIVAYFLIWGGMAWFYLGNSLKQDKTGEKSLTTKMQKFSAPIMIVFAATLVFSSFDLEMSLAPMWFSTMFPVYFFSGATLGGLAAITLTALILQNGGRVTDEITIDHFHDLAKLMFAFVVFWGYIAFSQFLLIWYANMPEETFWYSDRINEPGWKTISIILVVGHLFIPFLGLMARTVRRNKRFLFFASIYILIMHWVDHYWLIMPQILPGEALQGGFLARIAEVSCVIGLSGIFVAIFCLMTRDKPLVPLQDPRLGEALNFKNL